MIVLDIQRKKLVLLHLVLAYEHRSDILVCGKFLLKILNYLPRPTLGIRDTVLGNAGFFFPVLSNKKNERKK